MSGPGPHELVIIRRRGGGDDAAPKGGVWKIAFADFMTAMMAFFLVMWLINASNEATRSQVASYFNPIKLTDSSTGDKGLAASKTKPKDKKTEPAAEAKTGEAAEGAVATEEKLLSNPYTALDRVVAEHPRNSNGPGAAAGPAGADAFESLSWMAPPKTTVDAALRPEPPPPKSEVKAVAKSADVKEKVPAAVSAEKAPERSVKAAEAIKHEIFEKLKAAGQPLPAKIEVKPAGSGVLISLIDRHELNMFAVGSAEPSAELIRAVSSIAAVLKNRKGAIVIRGHTDARPYKNKKFDNWQLSTSRAHMAFYMLVRGGLDETRVKRIEGHAATDPKVPDRPEAAENRRIDILLEGEAP